MTSFLLILTVLVALALIGVILIQRSEGGGLGIGNSQGVGSFMTGRGTATLLTRSTAVLAGLFMLLCLTLAILNKGRSGGMQGHDILSNLKTASTTQAPATPKSPTSPASTIEQNKEQKK